MNRTAVSARTVLVTALSMAIVASLAARGAADQEGAEPVARLLSDLIRLNTSNPPGNEAQIAELLAGRLEPLGFEIDIVPTPETGKAHFIARLRGDGSGRPVLLAAHADVVGVEREKWSVDPFAGTIEGGYVLGRGAIDFKGGMAVFAEAVMRLARNRVPLARDVIFLVEADEEGGRYSTTWLAESHWPKIDCEFSLNEGGWIIKDAAGRVRYVSISTADKTSTPLVLTTRGTSTHSSMPRPDSAIFTLAKALAKLADYEAPPALIPSTRQFFRALAKTSAPPMSTHFANLADGTDPALVLQADREISKDPLLHAIMRNTIAPVLMNAGFRANVIPGSAEATINLRTIPGTNLAEFAQEIQRVIDDPRVGVRLSGPAATSPPTASAVTPSSEDTDLYRALTGSARTVFPTAEITPYLFQASTDAGAWRSRGIPVYGIYPYPIDAEDLTRMHGNDERVSVESLRLGVEMIYHTLMEVAARR